MSTEFIEHRIWARLTKAAKACRGPADIAVAYLSEGAAGRLPIRSGSRLVVDASEATVKAGLTCPADLLLLHDKGVRIFSVANLHAKVYLFGPQAFVGSANVSSSSANRLKEAMVRTTERSAVRAARAFLRGLCIDSPLGPEMLASLRGLYRRPRFVPGGSGPRPRESTRQVGGQHSALRLVQLILGEDPAGSESASEAGRRTAKSRLKHRRTHTLDQFRWHNKSIRRGQSVVQILDEGRKGTFVSPPGTVINTKSWSNGRQSCTFVYVERPRIQRIHVKRLAKRLGRGAFKKLTKSGRLPVDLSRRLKEVWRR